MQRILLRSRVWAAALAVVALIAFANWTRGGEHLAGVHNVLLRVASPFVGAVHAVAQGVGSVTGSVAELTRLRRENAELRSQLEALQGRLSYEDELQKENRDLLNLLHFKQGLVVPGAANALAASVIGRSPDTWFSQLIINRGKQDGVVLGMVAVTAKGVIGQVTAVQAHSATVMLITSPDSGVGAMVQRETSRATGVALGVAGDPNHLKLQFFARNQDVLPGDVVITSGLGQTYPKGLLLGYVDQVTEDHTGLVEEATLRPAVDLSHVENVLLLPPTAQQGTGSAGQ